MFVPPPSDENLLILQQSVAEDDGFFSSEVFVTCSRVLASTFLIVGQAWVLSDFVEMERNDSEELIVHSVELGPLEVYQFEGFFPSRSRLVDAGREIQSLLDEQKNGIQKFEETRILNEKSIGSRSEDLIDPLEAFRLSMGDKNDTALRKKDSAQTAVNTEVNQRERNEVPKGYLIKERTPPSSIPGVPQQYGDPPQGVANGPSPITPSQRFSVADPFAAATVTSPNYGAFPPQYAGVSEPVVPIRGVDGMIYYVPQSQTRQGSYYPAPSPSTPAQLSTEEKSNRPAWVTSGKKNQQENSSAEWLPDGKVSIAKSGLQRIGEDVAIFRSGDKEAVFRVGSVLPNGELVKKIDAGQMIIYTSKRRIVLIDEG